MNHESAPAPKPTTALTMMGLVAILASLVIFSLRTDAQLLVGMLAGSAAGFFVVGIVYGKRLNATTRPAKGRPIGDSVEGISPVIGVILMVAITVVLAAAVFVIVSHLGNPDVDPIRASFEGTTDDTAANYRLLSLTGDLDWGTCTLRGANGATLAFLVNAAQPVGHATPGDVVIVDHLQPNTTYDLALSCDSQLLDLPQVTTRSA